MSHKFVERIVRGLTHSLLTLTLLIAATGESDAQSTGIRVSSASFNQRTVQRSSQAQRQSRVKLDETRGSISPYEAARIKASVREERYEYSLARWQQKTELQRARLAEKNRIARQREQEKSAKARRKQQAQPGSTARTLRPATKAAEPGKKTQGGTTLIGEAPGDVEQPAEERPSFFARLLKLFGF